VKSYKEGEDISRVRFVSITPTPGTPIPTDVDVKFQGTLSYTINVTLHREIRIGIAYKGQMIYTLWTYKLKGSKGVISGTVSFSFTLYLTPLLGKKKNAIKSILLVASLPKFSQNPSDVHNDYREYPVTIGHGYNAMISISSISFHYLGKAKSLNEVPPALFTIPGIPLATKNVGDIVLKFRIDVTIDAEWSNVCPNASSTIYLVVRRLVIPKPQTYLTESRVEIELSPSNKGKDTYTLSLNSYIAPCYEDFTMIDVAIVLGLSTILDQVNVTRSTTPLKAYTKCDTSIRTTSPLVFYEEVINENGSSNVQYIKDLDVRIVFSKKGKVHQVHLKSDNMGRLVGNFPWLDESGKPIPGSYTLYLNKNDEALEEKYATTRLYPSNRFVIEVDDKGNIKPKLEEYRSIMKIECRDNTIYVTLRSIISWDNYVRSKIISFLRSTGMVSEREIEEIASIKTRYGTLEDEYDYTTDTIRYREGAYDAYADKSKGVPRDLQTIFHEWGHAVKEKLFPDPGIINLIGGGHKNTRVPSGLEIAYDEGHAEFFACLMIDYCQLDSCPYDRYVEVDYKGVHDRANEIEGRIAGFWLSFYNLESKPSDPNLAVKAYRDFLKTSRVFQRVFHEGTQKRPNIFDWKKWFNEFQAWKYGIKGAYKRPPRTINEWIYMRLAIAKDLNEVNRILECARDRGFILPNISYDEANLVQGKVSGKPYLIMGFVRVVGATNSYTLEGSEDIGVAVLNVGDRIVGQRFPNRDTFLKDNGGVVLRIDPSSLRIVLVQDILGKAILTVERDSFELSGTEHVGAYGAPVSITSGDITVMIRSSVEVVASEGFVSVKVFEGNVKVESPKGEVEVKSGNCVNITSNGEIGEVKEFEGNEWWAINFEKVKSSNPVVTQLKTYKLTESGFIEEDTFTYEDRYIFAAVKIHNCSVGDELVLVFEGPNNITYARYNIIKEDEYAEYFDALIICNYRQSDVSGLWKVIVCFNGKEKAVKYFTIKETKQQSNIVITDCKVCKGVENGVPKNITSEFNSKDTVYVWLSIENSSRGDEVKWVFQGPNNINTTIECKLNWTGKGYAYAWIYLYKYKPKDVEGRWKVIVYLNGKESLTTEFYVKPERSQCLIATATYGSELSSEVQLLRNFRDNIVLRTFAGKCFMNVFNMWYYSFSPTVAGFIANDPIAKFIMRIVLYPLISILYLTYFLYMILNINPELAIVLTGLIASSLIGLVYFTIPVIGVLLLVRKRIKKFSLGLTFLKILSLAWTMSLITVLLSELLESHLLMSISTSVLVVITINFTATYLATKILKHYNTRSLGYTKVTP